jgi:hypothetical protein
MVCYSSMSPLPLPASITLFCFYTLLFLLLHNHTYSVLLLFFIYTLCCLCMLYTAPLISIFRSCTQSHSTHMHNYRKSTPIFFVLHVFLTSSPLPDHHSNSSSSLVVMLYLFIISGHYPKILWLLWQLS